MGLDNKRFGGCVRVQLTSYARQNYICNELFTWVSRRDNYFANFICSARQNSRRIHVRSSQPRQLLAQQAS